MKEFNEARAQAVWAATNKCYKKACTQLGYSNFDLQSALREWEMTDVEARDKAEKLDQLYRELICKLPSRMLEDILTAVKMKFHQRSGATLDNISTELLQRELQSESQPKDT